MATICFVRALAPFGVDFPAPQPRRHAVVLDACACAHIRSRGIARLGSASARPLRAGGEGELWASAPAAFSPPAVYGGLPVLRLLRSPYTRSPYTREGARAYRGHTHTTHKHTDTRAHGVYYLR